MVGFLNQLMGAMRPTDRTWCCDRFREGAVNYGYSSQVAVQGLRPGHGSRLAESPQKPIENGREGSS
jgi:hypothetical protein